MASNSPKAEIRHASHGRLRLAVPSRKGNRAYFEHVEKTLPELMPGAGSVSTNHQTGSILILHDGAITTKALASMEHGVFHLDETTGLGRTVKGLAPSVRQAFRDADKKIKAASHDEIDTAGLAFLVLLGTGAYQIAKGNFAAPAWYTLFWYALNIFLKGLPKEDADLSLAGE